MAVAEEHAHRVGPDGPDNMWNVKGEYAENTPDDVSYIGKC